MSIASEQIKLLLLAFPSNDTIFKSTNFSETDFTIKINVKKEQRFVSSSEVKN